MEKSRKRNYPPKSKLIQDETTTTPPSVSHKRPKSQWFRIMHEGKKQLSACLSDETSAGNTSRRNVIELFESAIQLEMNSQSTRFRFWKFYLTLLYLQKSYSIDKELLAIRTDFELLEKTYVLGLNKCNSDRQTKLLTECAFEFIAEQMKVFQGEPSGAWGLTFAQRLLSISDVFASEDLAEKQLEVRVNVYDMLIEAYFNHLHSTNEDELLTAELLGLSKNDYLDLVSKLFEILQEQCHRFDSSLLFEKYNRHVRRILAEGLECHQELALSFVRHLDQLIESRPIPDFFSAHKLEFLELSFSLELSHGDVFKAETLLKRMEEELLAVSSLRPTDTADSSEYVSIGVDLYSRLIRTCVEYIPLDKVAELPRIEALLIQAKNFLNQAESPHLNYAVYLILRAKLFKFRYSGDWNGNAAEDIALAKKLLENLSLSEFNEIFEDRAEILITEAFFYKSNSQFTKMLEALESALQIATSAPVSCTYIAAKAHGYIGRNLYSIAEFSEKTRTASAAQHTIQSIALAIELKDERLLEFAEDTVAEFRKNYPHAFWHALVDEKLNAAREAM